MGFLYLVAILCLTDIMNSAITQNFAAIFDQLSLYLKYVIIPMKYMEPICTAASHTLRRDIDGVSDRKKPVSTFPQQRHPTLNVKCGNVLQCTEGS